MSLESPLRRQHELLGAQCADFFGSLLPDRYVELAGECKTARESVALFDTCFHAIFRLTGPDRVRFLNAVTTNNIKDLLDGQGNAGLLLNPQGHILAELSTHSFPDSLLVLSHASVRERTAATLEKYIIMDDVTLDDATEHYATLGIEGPAAGTLLENLCGITLAHMVAGNHVEATVDSVPCCVIRRSFFGELGAEFLVERDHVSELWSSLLSAVRAHRGGPIGYAALNALRLEARIPWFGYDFDDRVIPHEAGLENTHINFTKGCYTGQEIVERVRSRGQVNRRRVALQFLGLTIPEKGAPLFAADKEVGSVTSSAFSPHLGRVLGMGYVRREQAESGSFLNWSGGELEVL